MLDLFSKISFLELLFKAFFKQNLDIFLKDNEKKNKIYFKLKNEKNV